MFKLYKENKVNPFGGCWPMLLPYPLLVAVFFVLANTIELRGVPFLWMNDLSRFDPLYIIPVLMAVSMFAVSKIGMMGMPPNPQTKMMAYLMPVMMLVFFFKLRRRPESVLRGAEHCLAAAAVADHAGAEEVGAEGGAGGGSEDERSR